jgi:Arc/MetJ-type ribon-helix-helix transcriptional regulator
MNVSVDETSEQRIKRVIELGHFKNPEEMIVHALELLDGQETWLQDKAEFFSARAGRRDPER